MGAHVFRSPNATRAHYEQKHSLLQRVTPLVVQAEAERGCEVVQPRRRPRKVGQSAPPSEGGLHQAYKKRHGERTGKRTLPRTSAWLWQAVRKDACPGLAHFRNEGRKNIFWAEAGGKRKIHRKATA